MLGINKLKGICLVLVLFGDGKTSYILIYMHTVVNMGVKKKLTDDSAVVINFFITRKEVTDEVNNLNLLLS